MKNLLGVYFSVLVLFYVFSVTAEDRSGGEFRLGGTWAQTWTDRQDIYKRYGFDTFFGISENEENLASLLGVYFDGVFKSRENLFSFGFLSGFGPCLRDRQSFRNISLMVTASVMAMSVSTNHEVMWNPQIGLDLKLGVVYVRGAFMGNVGSEMGFQTFYGLGFVLEANSGENVNLRESFFTDKPEVEEKSPEKPKVWPRELKPLPRELLPPADSAPNEDLSNPPAVIEPEAAPTPEPNATPPLPTEDIKPEANPASGD